MRAPGDGELQGPSAAAAVLPRSPLGTHQRYSKRSPLTVWLRPQVQKYFLARLWLILADPMGQPFNDASGRTYLAGRSASTLAIGPVVTALFSLSSFRWLAVILVMQGP